jgi:predicted peptidase
MQDNATATNHINTWRIAYNIEVIREWFFEQLT